MENTPGTITIDKQDLNQIRDMAIQIYNDSRDKQNAQCILEALEVHLNARGYKIKFEVVTSKNDIRKYTGSVDEF